MRLAGESRCPRRDGGSEQESSAERNLEPHPGPHWRDVLPGPLDAGAGKFFNTSYSVPSSRRPRNPCSRARGFRWSWRAVSLFKEV
jgi:hypothetical protein